MTEEEMAVDWIRSQGWNEENLPSDELLQMKKAYLAGLKAGKDMAEADLATVAYMQAAELKQKLIEEHKRRISRGEELDFVCFELYKQLQEENTRLKKESEENQDLATIAYMQGASKYKTKLDEAKEIISAYIALVNRLHNVKIFNLDEKLLKKADAFLKE